MRRERGGEEMRRGTGSGRGKEEEEEKARGGGGRRGEQGPASVNGGIAVHNTRPLPAPRNVQHVDARRHASHTLSEAPLVRLRARRYEASVPGHPSFYALAFLSCLSKRDVGE
jgi:hypothetical protein